MHNRRCAPPVRPLPARSSSCALACWSDTWWRLCGSRRMLAAPTSSTYSCAWRAERNAQRVGPTQRRARAVGFKVDSYPSGGVEPCPGRFRRRTNPDRPPRLCTQVSGNHFSLDLYLNVLLVLLEARFYFYVRRRVGSTNTCIPMYVLYLCLAFYHAWLEMANSPLQAERWAECYVSSTHVQPRTSRMIRAHLIRRALHGCY